MPVPVESAHYALEHFVKNHESLENLPWDDAFMELSGGVTGLNTESPRVLAHFEMVLNSMVEDRMPFGIVCIFSPSGDSAEVIPIPERHFKHGESARIHFGTKYPRKVELDANRVIDEVRLVGLSAIQERMVANPGIVLVQQNLGAERNELPITVDNLNMKILEKADRATYEWIVRVQSELQELAF